MNIFYNVLKKTEVRPAMWTGEQSLKSIAIFLSGYRTALQEYLPDELNQNSITDFNNWVAKKLRFGSSTAGWQLMIVADTLKLDPKNIDWEHIESTMTKEQHLLSIRRFYELLEEWRQVETQIKMN